MLEEYYCPNCNAVLDDQDGFDSDLEVWVCTECGQALCSDRYEETAKKYEGVVWICDSCGELLNNQDGFDDTCEVWRCTECGYENPINEDEIYESEEEYQNRNKHKCPTCEAYIEDQWNYNEYEDTHTCEECGAELYKSDEGYQRLYRCPECDEILNEQWDFDSDDETYTCSRCDTELYKEDDKYNFLYRCPECDEILNKQTGFYEDDEWECEYCGTNLKKHGNEYACIREEKYNNDLEEPETYEPEYEENNKMLRSENIGEEDNSNTLSSEVAIKTVDDCPAPENNTGRSVKKFSHKNAHESTLEKISEAFAIEVGRSAYELRGESFVSVHRYLSQIGFSNIRLIPQYDICKETYYVPGEVCYISIGHSADFLKTDVFRFNSEIIIYFHEKKKIRFPYSSKTIKRKSYMEVYEKLSSMGYSEILLHPLKDLFVGWIKKDGEIDCVKVDGRRKYKVGLFFDFDTTIDVYYHSYKNDRRAKNK